MDQQKEQPETIHLKESIVQWATDSPTGKQDDLQVIRPNGASGDQGTKGLAHPAGNQAQDQTDSETPVSRRWFNLVALIAFAAGLTALVGYTGPGRDHELLLISVYLCFLPALAWEWTRAARAAEKPGRPKSRVILILPFSLCLVVSVWLLLRLLVPSSWSYADLDNLAHYILLGGIAGSLLLHLLARARQKSKRKDQLQRRER